MSNVRLELEPRASIPSELQGKLVLQPIEGKPLTLEAQVGAPVLTLVPCFSKWEVTAFFPDIWGPRTTVVAGASGTTVKSRISLWPLGRIAGSVKLVGKDLPSLKLLSVATVGPHSPAKRDLPKGLMDCPVDAQGRWQCQPLPAATFDLVLWAEGFIPQYRWDLKVVAGKTIDLGTVELQRGASVAGWIDVEEGTVDTDCRAFLVPLLCPGSGSQLAEKIRSTTREVAVRKDGFFQFQGVAPGNYSLQIRKPGFAAATVNPVEVWLRSETFLRQTVTLRRPLQLELVISPPLDWLDRPWKVLVSRISEAGQSFEDSIYNGSSDAQGLVTIPGQAPGRFQVTVSDKLDNRLAFQTFAAAGAEDSRQKIDLHILPVRGTVELGKEPLAATLWFGGRFGSSAVKMESAADGKFHGFLPRAGWWRVDVTASEPSLETQTKVKVEVDGQDRATADLHLPATRMFGRVLDDSGRPTPAATVSISTDEGNSVASTDAQGGFDLRGLPAGTAYAAAKLSTAKSEWTSDRIAVFLGDGEELGPIELRMRKDRRLSGKVQSSRGPVAGAGVVVIPLSPTLMFGDSVRAGLDGSFTAQVPDMTQIAAVIVNSPGYGLRAFSLDVGESSPSLTIGEESGELKVILPAEPHDALKDEVSLWVFQNGLPIPTGVLYQWIAGHGKDIAATSGRMLDVPEVAPGEYRVCLAAQVALASWQASGWMTPLAKCKAGQLAAGGTLQLDLSAN